MATARIPQPVKIVACLFTGLGLGLAFPQSPIVRAIAQSGTWFPRTIVTLATAIVFILMSATLARTLQSHLRGTRFLAIVVTLSIPDPPPRRSLLLSSLSWTAEPDSLSQPANLAERATAAAWPLRQTVQPYRTQRRRRSTCAPPPGTGDRSEP